MGEEIKIPVPWGHISAKMGEEIKIPVPWGHISGKMSGEPSGQIVLCLHGFSDNAGTFDHLIPFLPSNGFLFVAIDFPGHGKSSHFPDGLPISYVDFVYSVKLVRDFYKWSNIVLLCHSFGAQIGSLFTAIYPEFVQKLILLDGFLPFVVNNKNIISHFRTYFDGTQEIIKKVSSSEPPTYTYEEALARTMNNRASKLTRKSAETLIKRSLIPSGKNGVCFSLDQRLKTVFKHPFNVKSMAVIVDNIKCPIFIIIAQDTYNLLLNNFVDDNNEYLSNVVSLRKVPNIIYKIIEGNHDVHLNNAPIVAELVQNFLIFTKSSL